MNRSNSVSSRKSNATVKSQAARSPSVNKRERRKRRRERKRSLKRKERMLEPKTIATVEGKTGVKPGAFKTLVDSARGQAHQVAAMMLAVAAPAAIRPARLADSLSPERTSVIAFQQKLDIKITPVAENAPAVGQLQPVLGRAAFLIADPLYPLWLQGRPALCGASGQHFSMVRTLNYSDNLPYMTNLENSFMIDYSSLSSASVYFGTALGAVPAPAWVSPLGFHSGVNGWVYKPTCLMFQGYVTVLDLVAPALDALIEVEVQYYNGENMDEYTVGYIHQMNAFASDGTHFIVPFVVGTAVNSQQPPIDLPGGNVPRYSDAGWYRVKNFRLTPAAQDHNINPAVPYVAKVVSLTLGLTTDVRTATTISQFGDKLDCASKPLDRPGFTSTNTQFPTPYTLDETTLDASFFPCMPTQYVSEAPVIYRNCRCNAASALFSNVTAQLNKEGTVRAVRTTRASVNPWADWRADRTFTTVNPDYCKNFKLEDGLYVFAMPDARSLKFRDCIHDRTTATGGLGSQGPNASPIMDIGGFDNVMLMLFTDAGVGTTTQLQVTVDTHLEFKHNSPLWELRVTNMTPDDMAQAVKALQQMQHSFENPLHMSDILRYVQRAAGLLLPHVSPFLVDTFNKLAAPAVGYSIVPYKG